MGSAAVSFILQAALAFRGTRNRKDGGNMNNHKCPYCGKPTSGTWSEGGLKWDICQDCMDAEKLKIATDYARSIDDRLSQNLSEDEY